jgi:diguanylate cyclase (GGDEF)-like protein
VLIETALRLKQAIRDSDTVASIGGDEFVLLLENTASRYDLSAMAESLISTICSPYIIHGEAFEVSCSIGIATYPDEGTTTDALLAVADNAMYKAKHKSRGTYEF